MERTNYVAQAKTLMKKAVRNSALVIVPLAAAVAASANTVVPTLPTGNFTCGMASGSVNCASLAGVAAIPGSGINGVEFFTNGPLQLLPSGGTGLFFRDIGMSTHVASFSSSLGASLPVFYDFTLWATTGVTITSWNLTLSLFGRYSGSTNITGVGDGTFSGSDAIALTFNPGTPDLGVSAYFTAQGDRLSFTDQVRLDVPQNGSFDFGASAASAVPEPGTTGLVVAGLTLAGVLRRRCSKPRT